MWWILTATAHPEDRALFGHQMEVFLASDSLQVAATFEIPNSAIERDRRRGIADPVGSRQAELEAGLNVTVSSTSEAGEWTPGAVTVGPQFTTFALHFYQPIPREPAIIHIGNANAPETPAVYSTRWLYDGRWAIDEHNLAIEGQIPTTWRMDERMREIEVYVRPRWGWPRPYILSHSEPESRWPLWFGLTGGIVAFLRQAHATARPRASTPAP